MESTVVYQHDDALDGDEDGLSVDTSDEVSNSSDTSRDEVNEVRKIVLSDERKIRTWRSVLIVIIVTVGIAVTWMTYTSLAREEKKNFENAFDQHSVTIIESSSFTARAISTSYEAFSDHITSHAIERNATWPMFTVPHLERHGKNLRKQTLSLAFQILHFVEEDQRQAWENYTVSNQFDDMPMVPFIYTFNENFELVPDDSPGPWGPVWEINPTPIWSLRNFNLLPAKPETRIIEKVKHGVFGLTFGNGTILMFFPDETNSTQYEGEPSTTYLVPVYDGFDKQIAKMVALITGYIRWGLFFNDLLPEGVGNLLLVLDNGSCGSKYSWRIIGREAIFLGEGDMHDSKYNEYGVSSIFGEYDKPELVLKEGLCFYTVNLYPTKELQEQYSSAKPFIFAAVVGGVFVLVVVAFFVFDYFQTQRNNKILTTAAKTSAMVNSIFPAEFRHRLMNEQNSEEDSENRHPDNSSKKTYFASHNQRIKKFLEGTDDGADVKSKPLADFYPEVTIMFADLVGFTAWCSVREPSQVFVLLETLYAAYDQIAKKRRVFKVETVGDCYVAASGLPDKRKDHAVAMARFAHACLQKTTELMQRLEVQLGPDTGDLTIRIGLHSGPVTAGVLRGERARFQLFGDTMNIAARMESTGAPGSIHVSEETASMLTASNKKHWVKIRPEKVDVKGKGCIQTYWLCAKLGGTARSRKDGSTHDGSDISSSGNGGLDVVGDEIAGKRDRLVDWHVDVFSKLLKQIVVRRNAVKKAQVCTPETKRNSYAKLGQAPINNFIFDGRTCFDEVEEIIMLPTFDRSIAAHEQDIESVQLDPATVSQLRDYIRTISHMYNPNAFHNFEHASHVTMSVSKLLSRIVMPADFIYESEEINENAVRGEIASTLHDHTYGITSDPLTQFAVVFSALIHDVDHSGIPNVQLIQENPKLAAVYKNKSVAEQNSIVLAWDLLMDSCYADLRAVICASDDEQTRFRQLVVQTVLATDIADKELKALRNARWEDAFSENKKLEDPHITVNRKATIVIEHLIQASDVSHTMQHWHIYRKWNESFFYECYQAFLNGRSETDPSLNWYKGEIGFFDYYIIPLAKKLKECGVFGVASDEYLNYALRNRKEWEERGEEVVADMLHNFRRAATGGTTMGNERVNI